MSDPARPPEDRIDRYARGELSAAESRKLALQSLDSPRLFDDLTSAALAKAALDSPSVRQRLASSKVVRFPRKARVLAAAAAAAAGVALVMLYSANPRSVGPRPREAPATSFLTPALASSAKPGQPVLLASTFATESAPPGTAPVFRGAEPESRTPRQAGSIVSIEDGIAAIDLGSQDGLAKGGELEIFRDGRSTRAIGRLAVATVFRERARGRILAGQGIRVHDQVRVADEAHLRALREQVDAWNSVAVQRMLRGDYSGAEAPLVQAVSTSVGKDLGHARSVNNLGVLAELRGDRRKAASLYTDALGAFQSIPNPPPGERQAVESNLARIRGVR